MNIRDLKNRGKRTVFLCLIILLDASFVTISYTGSYLLRFDMGFPHVQYFNFKHTLIPITLIKIIFFYYFGLYRGLWRYTSLKDLQNIIKASLSSSSCIILFILIAHRFQEFARTVFFIDSILTVFLIGGFRLSLRILFRQDREKIFRWKKNNFRKRKKVVIVGAGDAGEKILREINDYNSSIYEVIGFLDDDPSKINRSIHGIKVLARIGEITLLAQNSDLDEIIIAMPRVSEEKMRSVIHICQKTGIKCKTIPSLSELINGKVNASSIRDVCYADLIGRTQISLDMERINDYLSGKRVMVTGAGGSIGSECCRQIALFRPRTLIMLDRAESSLFDIEMEIKHLFPQQTIVPILGSVTCLDRLKNIFHCYKPNVVFHAAAYKHVPMVEMHPCEGIYNNILGTRNLLEMAIKTECNQFVLISTDKAVKPTNIMGASKRVSEIILQLKHKELTKRETLKIPIKTKIMSVRFGNVIGSAGSVIPLFQKQIAHGGPLTVTHPEVIRYFMTLNEAVQLVLQAGAIGESGDIYILKMGKPIKIIDMAKDLIRLSGFEPYKDIGIEFTGLRPGEKLYEELIAEEEGIIATPHEKLMALRSNGSNGMHYRDLKAKIDELLLLAKRDDSLGIKRKLKEIVPEYTPQLSYEENISCDGEQMVEALL